MTVGTLNSIFCTNRRLSVCSWSLMGHHTQTLTPLLWVFKRALLCLVSQSVWAGEELYRRLFIVKSGSDSSVVDARKCYFYCLGVTWSYGQATVVWFPSIAALFSIRHRELITFRHGFTSNPEVRARPAGQQETLCSCCWRHLWDGWKDLIRVRGASSRLQAGEWAPTQTAGHAVETRDQTAQIRLVKLHCEYWQNRVSLNIQAHLQ